MHESWKNKDVFYFFNGNMLNEYYEKFLPICLLYTSDAADERSSVDLGGRRIITKKKQTKKKNTTL